MNQTGTGYAGSNIAATPREPTLNERLNMLSNRLQTSCDRIESVLARVNGVPQAERADPGAKLAQINPTLPLSTVVEHLESHQARLLELANGVERIA